MDLAPDFSEFFALLTEHRVKFVVVGAYALALHGSPRYTGDLDILVQPSHDVSWESVWAGRDVAVLGGLEIPFIGRNEFIENKRAAGRAKDLADIEALAGFPEPEN